MNAEDIVVGLITLNGGELVGRTRLQKQAYLLDRCGANFGLPYTYHHYGPYSFDLADGVDDTRAEGRIEIEERFGYHRVPYAIFRSGAAAERLECLGDLPADKARALLETMKGASDIVLELAATIVFLRDEWDYYGKGTIGPVEETKSRKSLKATQERLEKAVNLLCNLGLWEEAAPASR